MKFEEVENINENIILTEGLKYLKYSSALLKMAKKIKPKNKEAEALKSLAIKAANEFKLLEKKYAVSSKLEKKELKQQYKETKKKYAALVKKINIKRAIIGIGSAAAAVILTVVGFLLGERIQFEHYLKEFNISTEPLRMNDAAVDLDYNVNKYGHPEGMWDSENEVVRPDLTARSPGDYKGDYRKAFARDDNDTLGIRTNKIRNVIFNHGLDPSTPEGNLAGKEYYDILWKDFRAMEQEVDKIKTDSSPDLKKFDKAWEKLSKTIFMRRKGLGADFKEKWDKAKEMMKSGDYKTESEGRELYRSLVNHIYTVADSSKQGRKAAEAFDDTAVGDIFKNNLDFIDKVTSMDVDDYLESSRK